MNVSYEKNPDGLTAKITVAVEENDYAAKVKAELKKIGATQTIPGFRKGHVSVEHLTRRFGKEVKSEVINRVVIEAVDKYIKENNIVYIAEPLPASEPQAITMEQKDYTFAFEIALPADIDVKLDKDVKLPFYTVKVTDEMINEQDKALRERFGAQVPGEEADEKALVKGTIMELNEDGTVKESADAIQVIDGIVAPMFFKDKAQADKFLHCKVGDKIVFNPWATCEGNPTEMSSMLHITDKDAAANVKSDFELTVSEIIIVKPAELGEEFYKNAFGPQANIENEEQYRQQVAQMVAAQFAPTSQEVFQLTARKYLMDTYADGVKVPDAFLKRYLLLENPELTAEKLDEDFEKFVVPDVKWQLIRDEVGKKLDVKITEDDVMEVAVAAARRQFAQYGLTNLPEESYVEYGKKLIADKKTRQNLANTAATVKFFDAIKDAVSVEAKEVSVDELRAVITDLTKNDETAE